MEPSTIIFIGPQGSGKGTQIEKIKTVISTLDPERKLVDVQTGRLFRELIADQDTYAEKKIKESLSAGVLQPDFLTYVLWGQEMIKHLNPDSHLIIDGFPRTVAQAEVLVGALTFFERPLIHVINIDTLETVVRERMLSRARTDDTQEAIENRLRWYREDTLPVLDYYRNQSNVLVHDVDGNNVVDVVHEEILSALKLK